MVLAKYLRVQEGGLTGQVVEQHLGGPGGDVVHSEHVAASVLHRDRVVLLHEPRHDVVYVGP